jgi:hypothetical protein
MSTAAAVVAILLGLYERISKLLEGGTSAEVVQASLDLGLDTAAVVSRESIEARAGHPVDAAKVLAYRYDDLVRATRAAGPQHEANARIIEQLAEGLRREARQDEPTARVDVPGSQRPTSER